jgi:hypothetical protein
LRQVLATLKQTTTVCIYLQSDLPILVIFLCDVRYSFYNSLLLNYKTYTILIEKLDLKLIIIIIIVTNIPGLSEKTKRQKYGAQIVVYGGDN